MRYAEVSVNSPIAQRQTFSYSIPDGLNVEVGHAVWVPFGERVLQGIVTRLSPVPAVPQTRDIAGLIDPVPVLSPVQVDLACWLSQYYLASLFDSLALMLPPGFERKPITLLSVSPGFADSESLSPEQKRAFDLVSEAGSLTLRGVEKALGKKKAQAAITQLVRIKALLRQYKVEPVRIKPKKVPHLCLKVSPAEAIDKAIALRAKRGGKQADFLEFLAARTQPVPWPEARTAGFAKAVASALVAKGFVQFEDVEQRREPISYEHITQSLPLKLTNSQEAALQAVTSSLQLAKAEVFLLYGVTASGKTEVYLQALAEAIRLGKRGIVLVPEIALTPQTIERFAARFPHRVAVLHSRLSAGEQFDEWHRIRSGEFDVVIGARSALFAPLPDLGLIVIDEEHEWTYKQDTSPRYHTRDAAIKLAEMTGAVVILGSATPDVETYYHARAGGYHLLELPERVVPTENAALPPVEVVDLKSELKSGNRDIISRSLSMAMATAIERHEQVILFLNRRGASTFIQCRHCGFVLRCKRCEIPLTLHYAENALLCHQCNYRTAIPRQCPQCANPQMKFLGTGTQKVEEEVRLNFAKARLLRWDSDATRERGAHEKILSKFRAHEADILIGTQMVAKGLDLPLVTLVGVVNADTSMNLPQFRAGERTFQVLSQVAGRAGRGPAAGRIIIQTFAPEHYAIIAAAAHDYLSFYEKEIDLRRQFHNPPFARLARLVYTHSNRARCQREAERMRDLLARERDAKGVDVTLLGPAPAFIERLRGRYRWQLIVRGSEPSAFLSPIAFPQGWTVDIDPVNLL